MVKVNNGNTSRCRLGKILLNYLLLPTWQLRLAINVQGLVMASYVIDINDDDISLVAVHRTLRVCKLHGNDKF